MAMNLGPDSKLSQCVDNFITEVEDDFSAPHQSSFQNYMQKVKRDLQEMEEVGLHNNIEARNVQIFVKRIACVSV